jgi:hypothetical protein
MNGGVQDRSVLNADLQGSAVLNPRDGKER